MKKQTQKTFHIISLGCAKNLVDSHSYAALLYQDGLVQAESMRQAKYILVNTCGFIHDAREESYETIREVVSKKEKNQKLIVTGCLSERYKDKLLEEVSGIDGLVGTRNLKDLSKVISSLEEETREPIIYFPEYQSIVNQPDLESVAVQGNSAYLKIADGCRRTCAFCAIPCIKGPLVSRPLDLVLSDAKMLAAEGIKEINIIAQDPTDYGLDLYGKPSFIELLQKLTQAVPELPWLRVLYTFPGFEARKLAELMAYTPNLLPYLDLPLQHASSSVLKAMLRPSEVGWVRKAIREMRTILPELVIRTTFIVGFPNETEADFNLLQDFVEEIEFDHLGVFTYSPEEGTPAESLGDPVPAKVKEARRFELMDLQSKISLRKQSSLIGKEFDMLVEGSDPSQQVLVGRIWRDAPEVDGLVIAQGLDKGEAFAKVEITGVTGPDFYAKIL